ncbi:MAG: phosphotransferase [Planctomycetales bacterium]
MIELGPENVVAYLRAAGRLDRDAPAAAEPLAWGVSNVVLRVTPAAGPAFVVKQSRAKLRTEADWFSRLDRIEREAEILRALAEILPPGAVPAVLFEDRENHLFGMEAVAADHRVWKAELLAGRATPAVAATAGEYLGTIHGRSAGRAEFAERFGDREVFDQLRIDPFYRRIAAAHPAIRPRIAGLIEELLATRLCLVHADFSPKNILLAGDRLTLVDFETGHYGDPAFDLGFFLSHLALKMVLHAVRANEFLRLIDEFRAAYADALARTDAARAIDPGDLERRTVSHFAGCLLARIDGKSPVDYLHEEGARRRVRSACLAAFADPPATIDEALARLHQAPP